MRTIFMYSECVSYFKRHLQLRATRGFAAAAALMLVALTIASPTPAQASIRGGCAGTAETGYGNAVGWVDLNTMLQLGEEAETPELFSVISPDGTQVDYRRGEGLVAPTPSMPIWLAQVSGAGDYTIIIDGYDCVATVEPGSASELLTVDTVATGEVRPSEIQTDLSGETFWDVRTALINQ